jgi:predicted nucleotidyltransferase
MKIQFNNQLIKEFCQKNYVRRLALFGSVLRKDFNPESDVDILIEFAPGHKPDFFMFVQMEEQLSRILGGRKVDLVTQKSLNRRIRNKILDEAETLYAAHINQEN